MSLPAQRDPCEAPARRTFAVTCRRLRSYRRRRGAAHVRRHPALYKEQERSSVSFRLESHGRRGDMKQSPFEPPFLSDVNVHNCVGADLTGTFLDVRQRYIQAELASTRPMSLMMVVENSQLDVGPVWCSAALTLAKPRRNLRRRNTTCDDSQRCLLHPTTLRVQHCVTRMPGKEARQGPVEALR